MKVRALFGVLMALIVLSSCQRDPVGVDSPSISDVPEIQGYVERFIEAGRARGVAVPDDLLGITFEIGEVQGRHTLGICYYNPETPNHIGIDEEYWRAPSTTDANREMLLFHELGHCFLNRDHDDAVLDNGLCKSIMHADESNCSLEYGSNNETYLDELFALGIVAL